MHDHMAKLDKWFDEVDENDNVIGKRLAEEFRSNPDIIHHVVHFTLADKNAGKILLTKRSSNLKVFPGVICFPGEHIPSGETYEQATIRGVEEELGLAINQAFELDSHLFRFPKESEFTRLYYAFWDGEPIQYDEREIEKIWWVTPKELIETDQSSLSPQALYWIKNTDFNKVFK